MHYVKHVVFVPAIGHVAAVGLGRVMNFFVLFLLCALIVIAWYYGVLGLLAQVLS